jgi:hypothetical protein
VLAQIRTAISTSTQSVNGIRRLSSIKNYSGLRTYSSQGPTATLTKFHANPSQANARLLLTLLIGLLIAATVACAGEQGVAGLLLRWGQTVCR